MNSKKNILTVGPFLADEFVDKVEPTYDNSTYEKFLQDNQQRLGLFNKYLVGLLHDSWVIEIEQTDTTNLARSDQMESLAQEPNGGVASDRLLTVAAQYRYPGVPRQ